MEWEAPGIVLAVRPFGEGDAVCTVFTELQGRQAGLARGGASRRLAGTWQPGNLVQARWVGRLADQLGTYTAEMVHATAALVLDDALGLAVLSAACAVAEGALPEREPHTRIFAGLLALVAHLSDPMDAVMRLVRWEATVLGDLGYGLDLTRCAVTGLTGDLAYVSPRTGRAVAAAAAGIWRGRLLELPAFLLGDAAATAAELAVGLRLTGHFLARDAFGAQHRPLPSPRLALYDRVVRLAFPQGVPEPEVQDG